MPKLSISEYIAQEKENNEKYEYHDGEIFAMAGGTYHHGLLCGNIYSELRRGIRKKGNNCKALSSEIKLNIKSRNSYVYPDAMVICNEVQKSAEDKHSVSNPTLIAEVLSKSTASYDRGDKFHLYRQIASLKEYVLIEQEKAVVEVYYKKEESDLWKITRYEGLDKTIFFESISIDIKMSDLYFDIELS